MNTIVSIPGQILIGVLLAAILAIVLLIGWSVNRKRSQNIWQLPMLLKERYDKGEIFKKEYEDVKREIEKPLDQLNYYLKIYR